MLRAFLMAALFSPSIALAQDAAGEGAAATSQYASLLPLLFIFAIFYVLLIRPQQKRMKEHQSMLGELAKGDEVVTGGGIVGKISKVDGERLVVEIAKGVEVAVLKSTVSTVLGKTPAPAVVADKKKSANVKNDNSVVSRENVANDN